MTRPSGYTADRDQPHQAFVDGLMMMLWAFGMEVANLQGLFATVPYVPDFRYRWPGDPWTHVDGKTRMAGRRNIAIAVKSRDYQAAWYPRCIIMWQLGDGLLRFVDSAWLESHCLDAEPQPPSSNGSNTWYKRYGPPEDAPEWKVPAYEGADRRGRFVKFF